ncbi:MAG: hypothetical protein IJT13_03795 [Bacteroidaceae bacterium]|nr:hypothetical protein [Bacteroidaceae bacterium]
MKRLVLFTAFIFLLVACSQDNVNDVLPESKEKREQINIDKVIEELNKILSNGEKISYEQIQSCLSKYSGVTTYNEDGLLKITTDDGGSFLIDKDDICSLKENPDSLEENYEDVATMIEEIDNELFPKDSSMNVVAALFSSKQMCKENNTKAVKATSSTKSVRYLKKKRVFIWNPWGSIFEIRK